jgi:hypothetical protein
MTRDRAAHPDDRRLKPIPGPCRVRAIPLEFLPAKVFRTDGFVRIRFFGFMANRRRGILLPVCRNLLRCGPQKEQPLPEPTQMDKRPTWSCPLSGCPMVVIERLTTQQIYLEFLKQSEYVDTS